MADLDGDGKLDLAVAEIYGNGVSVLPGHGDGTFGGPTSFASGGSYTRRVAVADLNSDGKPDLVTASYQSSKGVSVFLGRGDGTFGAATTYSAGSVSHRHRGGGSGPRWQARPRRVQSGRR